MISLPPSRTSMPVPRVGPPGCRVIVSGRSRWRTRSWAQAPATLVAITEADKRVVRPREERRVTQVLSGCEGCAQRRFSYVNVWCRLSFRPRQGHDTGHHVHSPPFHKEIWHEEAILGVGCHCDVGPGNNSCASPECDRSRCRPGGCHGTCRSRPGGVLCWRRDGSGRWNRSGGRGRRHLAVSTPLSGLWARHTANHLRYAPQRCPTVPYELLLSSSDLRRSAFDIQRTQFPPARRGAI